MIGARLPRRQTERRPMDSGVAVVNLVLLLLFFFMVAGQALRPDNDVALARTDALPLAQLPTPILVVRGPDDWMLDGVPIAPQLLPAALPPVPASGPQSGGSADGRRTLHLMLDRDAPAALLVDTLARPVLADYRLRLVTLREAGASTDAPAGMTAGATAGTTSGATTP